MKVRNKKDRNYHLVIDNIVSPLIGYRRVILTTNTYWVNKVHAKVDKEGIARVDIIDCTFREAINNLKNLTQEPYNCTLVKKN